MKFIEIIKKYRTFIIIALALTGIGLMLYYDYCGTACSYLKGDIFGIELKWIGIAYMILIITFTIFHQADFVRVMLAAGLGAEIFLFSFQMRNQVFCPLCLAFSATVITAFIAQYEASPAWLKNQRKMWLYFLGEVNFPKVKIKNLPLVVVALAGYFFVLFTFSGSVLPTYVQNKESAIPTIGKGPYEVLIFSDYFCHPCQRINLKASPLLKELLSTGKVKITFIDVPFNQYTPMYASIFLYAVNASVDDYQVLHIRKTLFEAAQKKHIKSQKELIEYLKKEKIPGKSYDIKPVFATWSKLIKEYNVRETPTCLIKYSSKNTKKYIGDIEIWNGLTKLKSYI